VKEREDEEGSGIVWGCSEVKQPQKLNMSADLIYSMPAA
jgi:hypothetical protein